MQKLWNWVWRGTQEGFTSWGSKKEASSGDSTGTQLLAPPGVPREGILFWFALQTRELLKDKLKHMKSFRSLFSKKPI